MKKVIVIYETMPEGIKVHLASIDDSRYQWLLSFHDKYENTVEGDEKVGQANFEDLRALLETQEILYTSDPEGDAPQGPVLLPSLIVRCGQIDAIIITGFVL